MEKEAIVSIFLASTSRFKKVRQEIKDLYEGKELSGLGKRVRILRWEDMHPQGFLRIQDAINSIIDKSDIAVFLLDANLGRSNDIEAYWTYLTEEFERCDTNFVSTGLPNIAIFSTEEFNTSADPRIIGLREHIDINRYLYKVIEEDQDILSSISKLLQDYDCEEWPVGESSAAFTLRERQHIQKVADNYVLAQSEHDERALQIHRNSLSHYPLDHVFDAQDLRAKFEDGQYPVDEIYEVFRKFHTAGPEDLIYLCAKCLELILFLDKEDIEKYLSFLLDVSEEIFEEHGERMLFRDCKLAILIGLSNYELASKQIEEFLHKGGYTKIDEGRALGNLATVYFRMGKVDKALNISMSAIQIMENDTRFDLSLQYEMHGEILIKKDELVQVKKYFLKAIYVYVELEQRNRFRKLLWKSMRAICDVKLVSDFLSDVLDLADTVRKDFVFMDIVLVLNKYLVADIDRNDFYSACMKIGVLRQYKLFPKLKNIALKVLEGYKTNPELMEKLQIAWNV